MLGGLRRRSLSRWQPIIGVLRSHQNTKPSACTASVEPPLTVPCTRARRAAANLDCRHTLSAPTPWPGNAGSIVERTRHFARISPQFARLLAQVSARARIRSLPSPAGRWPLPKSKALYVCAACGATAAQWQGQCASCGEWNSLQSAPAPLRDGRRRTAPAGSGSAELQIRSPQLRQGLTLVDGHRGTRPGVRRRAGQGLGGAARGRSRHRQVDAAAAGGGGTWSQHEPCCMHPAKNRCSRWDCVPGVWAWRHRSCA